MLGCDVQSSISSQEVSILISCPSSKIVLQSLLTILNYYKQRKVQQILSLTTENVSKFLHLNSMTGVWYGRVHMLTFLFTVVHYYLYTGGTSSIPFHFLYLWQKDVCVLHIGSFGCSETAFLCTERCLGWSQLKHLS